MIQFTNEALKAALYANRKRMSKAIRRQKKKPITNIYPWATERRYAAAVRSWLKPMTDFVSQYLKNNQEAILRGDSAALTRNDTVPGGSFRRMIASLNGWLATYIPPIEDNDTRRTPPTVYMGLSNIAESLEEFSGNQWNRAAKANLGVEFPVYESWWPETKQRWADENYRLISKMATEYIDQVNRKAELAVTNGWSPRQLAAEIRKSNASMTRGRANLIARDQIGKLNGQTTQARMEAVGLDLYEWSTSLDERVRDSHAEMEGKLCKWADSTVYSDDVGKTWKIRPASWCQFHPGYDIQCRCTALSYWQELVNEVDHEIEMQESGFISVRDPAEPGVEFPEDPHLPSMEREYTSRGGQKVESLDTETDYVRRMGMAAGNTREYGTYIIDDVIIEPVRGTKSSSDPSAETEKLILNASDNSARLVHFHTSGCSFGPEDLGTFGSISAFSEFRVTNAGGITFSMQRNNDSIITERNIIEKKYAELVPRVTKMLKEREDMNFNMLSEQKKDILVSRGVSQALAHSFRWDYKEKD